MHINVIKQSIKKIFLHIFGPPAYTLEMLYIKKLLVLGNNLTDAHSKRPRSDHPVAGLWHLSSALGVIGTILNTFVLKMFIQVIYYKLYSVIFI